MSKMEWEKFNKAQRVEARIVKERCANVTSALEDEPSHGFLGASDLLGDRQVYSRDGQLLGISCSDGENIKIKRRAVIAKRI